MSRQKPSDHPARPPSEVAEYGAQGLQAAMEAPTLAETERIQTQLDSLNATVDDLERRIAERTADLRLQFDVASAANQANSVQDAFRFALRRIARHMGWIFGQVFFPFDRDPELMIPADVFYETGNGRFDQLQSAAFKTPVRKGQGMVGRVYQTGNAEWVTDVSQEQLEPRFEIGDDLRVRTAAAFPVKVDKQVGAVMEFFSDAEILPQEPLLQLMEGIGNQLGQVLERKQLERRIADAIDERRRTIGFEMHEGVAQQLTGAMMMAEDLRRQLAAEILPSAATAGRLVECVQEAQQQVCRLSRGLLPVEVDAHGLMAALGKLCAATMQQTSITTRFECLRDVLVHDNVAATHLFHIAQEALQNAVGHARARTIIVRLEQIDSHLHLTIHDDGVGLPDDFEEGDGIGYRVMRYRARLIGAQLLVSSERGHGTTLTCELRQDNFAA